MKKMTIIAALVCAAYIVLTQSAFAQSALTSVAPEYVCMVNNRVFPNAQIPVQHEGKTYYGCCPMCKERLTKDASMRYAIDPVSGAKVDKALAVIGVNAGGNVFYFETIENMNRYK